MYSTQILQGCIESLNIQSFLFYVDSFVKTQNFNALLWYAGINYTLAKVSYHT